MASEFWLLNIITCIHPFIVRNLHCHPGGAGDQRKVVAATTAITIYIYLVDTKIPMHFWSIRCRGEGAGEEGAGGRAVQVIVSFILFSLSLRHQTFNSTEFDYPSRPIRTEKRIEHFWLWCAHRVALYASTYLCVFDFPLWKQSYVNHSVWCNVSGAAAAACCLPQRQAPTRRKAIKMCVTKKKEKGKTKFEWFTRVLNVLRTMCIPFRCVRSAMCMCVGFYTMRNTRQINSSFKSVSNWVNVNFILIEFFVSVNSSRTAFTSRASTRATFQSGLCADACGAVLKERSLLPHSTETWIYFQADLNCRKIKNKMVMHFHAWRWFLSSRP